MSVSFRGNVHRASDTLTKIGSIASPSARFRFSLQSLACADDHFCVCEFTTFANAVATRNPVRERRTRFIPSRTSLPIASALAHALKSQKQKISPAQAEPRGSARLARSTAHSREIETERTTSWTLFKLCSTCTTEGIPRSAELQELIGEKNPLRSRYRTHIHCPDGCRGWIGCAVAYIGSSVYSEDF